MPTLASFLPVPQKYYLPGRLRDMYKPRLEAADLMDLADDDGDDEDGAAAKKASKWMRNPIENAKKEASGDEAPEKVKKTFAREKVCHKVFG